jgi:ClpP class serine protease
VVHITGPLEHRGCAFGDSYEAIRERFSEALAGEAETIVLRVDSPGGVVSGLNQAVFSMRQAKDEAGKRVIVYVDELACSAAYALACVADEIVMPPSAVVGSIGVRSEMCDQTEADKKAGIRWELITSGTRKAEGDPRMGMSEGAVKREQQRVDKLAVQFFDIVSDARGLSTETIAGYQAGTFLGDGAVEAGLADDVMGWDDLMAQIGVAPRVPPVQTSVAQSGTPAAKESPMTKLIALIAQAKKKLAAEKDAGKRSTLKAAIAKHEALLFSQLPPVVVSASLKAMKKTKYKLEEEETTEDDDPEKDDDDSDEDASDDEASDDEGDKDAADDEDATSAEDDEASDEDAEDDEPKKSGKKAAIEEKAAKYDALQEKVAQLEASEKARARASAIESALAGRRITKQQAKMLSGKKLAFVTEYLGMHTKKLMLIDGEEHLPDGTDLDKPMGAVTDAQMSIFKKAAAASGGTLTVEDLIKAYKSAPNAVNGIPGKRA